MEDLLRLHPRSLTSGAGSSLSLSFSPAGRISVARRLSTPFMIRENLEKRFDRTTRDTEADTLGGRRREHDVKRIDKSAILDALARARSRACTRDREKSFAHYVYFNVSFGRMGQPHGGMVFYFVFSGRCSTFATSVLGVRTRCRTSNLHFMVTR